MGCCNPGVTDRSELSSAHPDFLQKEAPTFKPSGGKAEPALATPKFGSGNEFHFGSPRSR